MAKTLRVRTRAGWVTKPSADIPENRLTSEEVDDNFLAMEDEKGTYTNYRIEYNETTDTLDIVYIGP